MSRLSPKDIDAFNDTVSSVNALFKPKRPLVITKGPPEYEGLMIAPEGFFRAVYDQNHKAFMLFYSKVADNLKGQQDEDGNYRFTASNLQRAYPVSALPLDNGVDPGNPGLTARQARHFRRVISDTRSVIRDLTQNQLSLNVMRFGDNILFANRLNSYSIRKTGDNEYTAGISIPLHINDEGNTPRAKSLLLQKTLIKKAPLAEAYHAVMVNWQATTGATWDGKDVYATLDLTKQRKLAKIYDYAARHQGELGLSYGISGGAYTLKGQIDGADLAGAALATYATAHTLAHALGTGGIDKLSQWKTDRAFRKSHASIKDFRPDEDAIALFVKDEKGANRPFKHVNQNGGHHSDYVCLNKDQILAMADDNASFVEHLSPGFLRGVAINAAERAFSACKVPITPDSQMTRHQSGLLTYNFKEQTTGQIHRFVTERRDMCLTHIGLASEEVELPEEYREQIFAGGQDKTIQYYVQDTHPDTPIDQSVKQEALTLGEFTQCTKDLHRASTAYLSTPKRHTDTALDCAAAHFNLETVSDDFSLYMSGNTPELPDHTSFTR